MNDYIALLGKAPPADVAMLEAALDTELGHHRCTVRCFDTVDEIASVPLPRACISFLPGTRKQLLNFFAALPVGMSYHLPYFQRTTRPTSRLVSEFPLTGVFQSPLTPVTAGNIVHTIEYCQRYFAQSRDLMQEVMRYRRQKHHLIEMSTLLSSQNDLETLLQLILGKCREVVQADAGSIYLRERKEPQRTFIDKLRFRVAQNDSIDIRQTQEFVLDIDPHTISGYVAYSGQPLNIADVYELNSTMPFSFGKAFDRKLGYRTKSMLTVPLKNPRGATVGVLQLMNRKRDEDTRLESPETVQNEVEPFTHTDQDFVTSIASLIAVTIERAQLHEDIQHIFEGFLQQSIATIDERDTVTSGHSRRVMEYAMAFVDAINRETEGPFADIIFDAPRRRQFKFAALLHDIGKIGVPEALLTKNNRLTAGQLDAFRTRMELARFALKHAGSDTLAWRSVEDLQEDIDLVLQVNGTGFIDEATFEKLKKLRDKRYPDADGNTHPILTEAEWESLSVKRGNLTTQERVVVNSHSLATMRILSQIPWTQDLAQIPEIAALHHEKLDGSGYPYGYDGSRLSLESKILAIVDIFEALVAQDRPYKPAMPPQRALSILQQEVEAGHLDAEVVAYFRDKRIYEKVLDPAAPGQQK